MNIKGKLIVLGTCAAIGAALAIPAIGGAKGAVSYARKAHFALNAGAVSSVKVSKTGEKPSSLVPTDSTGHLPDRVVNVPTLKAGNTITGVVGTQWVSTLAYNSTTGAGDVSGASASFPFPLPVALPLTNFGVLGGAGEDPECTGTFLTPTAPEGHLCIYPGAQTSQEEDAYGADEADVANIALNGEGNYEVTAYEMTGAGSRYGFRIEAKALATGPAKFFATWAYTAPAAS